jgi:hypothetical protein
MALHPNVTLHYIKADALWKLGLAQTDDSRFKTSTLVLDTISFQHSICFKAMDMHKRDVNTFSALFL